MRQEEQIVSIGLFKFDLAPLKDLEIESAVLQLFSVRADLAQPPRLVDLSLVSPGAWTEAEVNFTNRPSWSLNPIATTAVYGANLWYGWDVSGTIIGQKETTITYALGMRLEEKREEQVVFASHEAGRAIPRLVVTYKPEPAQLPWWIWVAAIGGAAVVAFSGAFWLARSRPMGRAPKKA